MGAVVDTVLEEADAVCMVSSVLRAPLVEMIMGELSCISRSDLRLQRKTTWIFVSPPRGFKDLSEGAGGIWGGSETSSTGVAILDREGLVFVSTERGLLPLGCALLVGRAPRGGSVRRVAIDRNNFTEPWSKIAFRRCRAPRWGRIERRRGREGRPRRDSTNWAVTVSPHEAVRTNCPSGMQTS